jgi:hypothetical protein
MSAAGFVSQSSWAAEQAVVAHLKAVKFLRMAEEGHLPAARAARAADQGLAGLAGADGAVFSHVGASAAGQPTEPKRWGSGPPEASKEGRGTFPGHVFRPYSHEVSVSSLGPSPGGSSAQSPSHSRPATHGGASEDHGQVSSPSSPSSGRGRADEADLREERTASAAPAEKPAQTASAPLMCGLSNDPVAPDGPVGTPDTRDRPLLPSRLRELPAACEPGENGACAAPLPMCPLFPSETLRDPVPNMTMRVPATNTHEARGVTPAFSPDLPPLLAERNATRALAAERPRPELAERHLAEGAESRGPGEAATPPARPRSTEAAAGGAAEEDAAVAGRRTSAAALPPVLGLVSLEAAPSRRVLGLQGAAAAERPRFCRQRPARNLWSESKDASPGGVPASRGVRAPAGPDVWWARAGRRGTESTQAHSTGPAGAAPVTYEKSLDIFAVRKPAFGAANAAASTRKPRSRSQVGPPMQDPRAAAAAPRNKGGTDAEAPRQRMRKPSAAGPAGRSREARPASSSRKAVEQKAVELKAMEALEGRQPRTFDPAVYFSFGHRPQLPSQRARLRERTRSRSRSRSRSKGRPRTHAPQAPHAPQTSQTPQTPHEAHGAIPGHDAAAAILSAP